MSLEESSPDHQLGELGLHNDTLHVEPFSAVPSLPPADGGRAAWLFLLGSFVTEMLLWGAIRPFIYI